MKRLVTIIAWLALLGQPGALFADYVMGVTRFNGHSLLIFKMSNEGDLSFDYEVPLDDSLSEEFVFAPNGRWGLVGPDISVVKVGTGKQITCIGHTANEGDDVLAISPDSQFGTYGCYLQTLRYYSDGRFEVIPCANSCIAWLHRFSSLNNRILALRFKKYIDEYVLMEDGKTTFTGVSLDISPSTGKQDLEVSPDGKTCIVLYGLTYQITSLRVHEQGGFSIAHRFDADSPNPSEVDFTPDSQFAIVAFQAFGTHPDLISYKINADSTLTLVDSLPLPEQPGEDMAVTPDGKFAVTRHLDTQGTHFNVVRIHDNGTLEYLPTKDFSYPGHCSCIDFLPPGPTAWVLH